MADSAQCPTCAEAFPEEFDHCPDCGRSPCPECGSLIAADAKSCDQCGAEFGIFCSNCDLEIESETDVCPRCGEKLESPDLSALPEENNSTLSPVPRNIAGNARNVRPLFLWRMDFAINAER